MSQVTDIALCFTGQITPEVYAKTLAKFEERKNNPAPLDDEPEWFTFDELIEVGLYPPKVDPGEDRDEEAEAYAWDLLRSIVGEPGTK